MILKMKNIMKNTTDFIRILVNYKLLILNLKN